jgi:hypothetical protein
MASEQPPVVNEQLIKLLEESQDDQLTGAERTARLLKLDPLLRATCRGGGTGAAAAAEQLLAAGFANHFAAAIVDLFEFVLKGDLKGCSNAADVVALHAARAGAYMTITDGQGNRNHQDWRHTVHDGLYSKIPGIRAAVGVQIAAAGASDGLDGRQHLIDERLTAVCATLGGMISGGKLAGAMGAATQAAMMVVSMAGSAAAEPVLEKAMRVLVLEAGVLEASAAAMQTEPLDSVDMYIACVCPAYMAALCMADRALTARFFASGILEAVVCRSMRRNNYDEY